MNTDDIKICESFPEYLTLSRNMSNKVGFLTWCFKRLHPHAPPEDLDNLGGRIARLWVISHKDTGYLLKIIYISAAESVVGSHLNYIQAILNKNNRYIPLGQQRRAGVSDEHINKLKKLEEEVRNK